uniref:Uncharacterized protein n=1 Tax=virus sp. ctQiC1 TaxID=2825817 RepID=A0A8S5RMR2_9VIRU|nr:MAG TPA: hypothetical protein [virus sp. ctQiC1]
MMWRRGRSPGRTPISPKSGGDVAQIGARA